MVTPRTSLASVRAHMCTPQHTAYTRGPHRVLISMLNTNRNLFQVVITDPPDIRGSFRMTFLSNKELYSFKKVNGMFCFQEYSVT